jgi:Meiotically up-regulated gene 113
MVNGHLYVISTGNHAKIGIAKDVRRRLVLLQTGCPIALHVVAVWKFDDMTAALKAERVAHWACRDFRLRGEWFDRSGKAVAEKLRPMFQGREWSLGQRKFVNEPGKRHLRPRGLANTRGITKAEARRLVAADPSRQFAPIDGNKDLYRELLPERGI